MEHEGRADLRGLVVPDPKVAGEWGAGGAAGAVVDGVVEFRGVKWDSVDLSHGRLTGARFFDSMVVNCLFDAASCRDWRLWKSSFRSCSFVGADLRDAALGTWHEARGNVWIEVSFDDADLRGVLFSGGEVRACSFRQCRLRNAEFLHVSVRDAVFSGDLRDVLFDGRDLPGKPASRMEGVDFVGATFADVEFRGYCLDDVRFPLLPGIRVVRNYPVVARQALAIAEATPTTEGRMMTAELRNALKMPGADESGMLFNRADYVVSGGEEFAQLAERLLGLAGGVTD